MSARVARLWLAVAAIGCAQPGTPPGGEPDRLPPRVIEVGPAAFDTITDLERPVTIRFDERLSERLDGIQSWADAVVVSPATSPVRVEEGRRSLAISLVEGWEPDRVYRVLVLPVYRDLFGNVRREPIELVFSTGAAIRDAAIAGFTVDRITGDPVEGARIRATRRIDQVEHLGVADSSGFFALRYLPAGTYDVLGWLDDSRDRVADFFEIQDSGVVTVATDDTAVVELGLLPPDTTPARLARASLLDSTAIELHFDDYFTAGPTTGDARIFLLPDTTPASDVELVHPTRLDSVRTVRSAVDSVVARAQSPRPTRELIALLPAPLEPDTTYWVRVRAVTNINGLGEGGGGAAFRTPPAPPPDTAGPARTPPDDVPDPGPGDVPPDTGRLAEPPPKGR